MPTLYMLVGIPASGKSTWLGKQDLSNAVVLSTDDYIEAAAKQSGKTYDDVFKDTVGMATNNMYEVLRNAINEDRDIYWDQTNLNAKSRKNKLKKVPDYYRKVAVVFKRPDMAELNRRLGSRPGKTIPPRVLLGMMNSYEDPTKDEGFDEIVTV